MVTHLQSFVKSVEVEDHLGKPLNASEVFSKSLIYMREEVMKMLENDNHTQANNKDNIHWIITVPAIWEEVAKQFMRNAAKHVNTFYICCYEIKKYLMQKNCKPTLFACEIMLRNLQQPEYF